MSRVATVAVGGLVVLLAAAAASNAPLWVYGVSLALFGLPHVLVELRYVDERFSARLPRWAMLWLGAGLLAVALLRAMAFLGVRGGLASAELALGVGLVAILVPLASARAAAGTAALGFFAAGLLLVGVVYAPIEALVVLALLHNLTPVGFLAERLCGRQRALALAGAAGVFGLVPLAIVLWPAVPAVVAGPFGMGDLAMHLHAFVPRAWIGGAFGERLFAAAAYLQVMHYAVVLGVLPRLGGGSQTDGAVVPWPSRRAFALGVAVVGSVAAAGFAFDFGGARSGYRILAAVHAWIEIPVLLAACAFAPIARDRAAPAASVGVGAA